MIFEKVIFVFSYNHKIQLSEHIFKLCCTSIKIFRIWFIIIHKRKNEIFIKMIEYRSNLQKDQSVCNAENLDQLLQTIQLFFESFRQKSGWVKK